MRKVSIHNQKKKVKKWNKIQRSFANFISFFGSNECQTADTDFFFTVTESVLVKFLQDIAIEFVFHYLNLLFPHQTYPPLHFQSKFRTTTTKYNHKVVQKIMIEGDDEDFFWVL